MKKNKSSQPMQNIPSKSSSSQKSHPFKFKLNKVFFKIAFKALEVALVGLQIVQCLCEIFKR
ncbi:hypothetical protein [Hydrogenoanaerobacterium sp.]|uniref:hypothetical protein n=1 Tax=Hydrogenoanaerobacterium sp. TaxID=2953763 RepID=UPI00289DF005|nr:hypothetical protein [Hydrogenoanaerobacterium sp.]